MQIVIDIPEDMYKVISEDKYGVHQGRIYDIIRNGTPLEQEPKEGHWEYVQYDYNFNIGNLHCSECRTIAINAIRYKYCPNCGAKMKAESEVEE